jgi:hypothetical protein
LEAERIVDLKVDKLIISLEGNASDSSGTEVKDDVQSGDQLSRIEDLA